MQNIACFCIQTLYEAPCTPVLFVQHSTPKNRLFSAEYSPTYSINSQLHWASPPLSSSPVSECLFSCFSEQ